MKRLLLIVSVFALSSLIQPASLHAQAKTKAKTMSAIGMVKSVSGSSLTITAAGGKEMTFTVDEETKFVGKGLSTMAKKKGTLTATDAVGMNDRVSVSYQDMSGAMHATNVRVMNKAPKK
jgi:hypothetical protein